ncbi:MAG: hypothetical protein VX594_02135 [Actinomycetota bacterium]|nr:hypothetical protein [Actinomycetota bacterium]
MIDQEKAFQISEILRELVKADGGDVTLEAFSDNSISLLLVLDGTECRECVMPAEFLSQILLDQGKKIFPALDNVIINDPRTTNDQ